MPGLVRAPHMSGTGWVWINQIDMQAKGRARLPLRCGVGQQALQNGCATWAGANQRDPVHPFHCHSSRVSADSTSDGYMGYRHVAGWHYGL
ncbi:hypothetical protein GCM10027562_41940 [Arthrobacter pigmenti]